MSDTHYTVWDLADGQLSDEGISVLASTPAHAAQVYARYHLDDEGALTASNNRATVAVLDDGTWRHFHVSALVTTTYTADEVPHG